MSLFSLVTLFDFALEASLVRVAVRESAECPERASEWVTAATVLRLGIGAVGQVGCLVFVHIAGYPPQVFAAACIASLLLWINPFRSPIAVFRANLQMHWELAVTMAARVLESVAHSLVRLHRWRDRHFFFARVLSAVLFASMSWVVAHNRFQVGWSLSRAALRRIGMKAVPLGIESLLVMVQLKVDILLVAFLRGPEAGGLYGAVAQLAEFSLLVPEIVLTPVFSYLTRSYATSAFGEFRKVYQATFDLLVVAVLPGVVAVWLFPEIALGLLFGSEYLAAAPVLRWLVWVIALLYIAGLTGTAAVAINRQSSLARVQVVNVLVYLALNLAFIPRWSYGAAVFARLVAVIMGTSMTYRIVRRGVDCPLRLTSALFPAVVGAGAMAGTISLLAPFGTYPALAAGCAVYLGALWVLVLRKRIPDLKSAIRKQPL